MKDKFKSIWAKDWVFYGFLIFIIIFIGQLPILLHIFRTPAGFYYPYLDKISFSDYYYLGLIRYGMGPEWLLRIPYVTEPHQASLIQVFFVWLGKLALITHIGPAEIFALFRVIGGFTFLLSSVFFFKLIFSPRLSRLAFVFFLFAQPLFLWEERPILKEFAVWVWHFGEGARRVSLMPPHYALGKGLAVFSLCFLILAVRKQSKRWFLSSLVCVFVAGMVYPPPVFLIGLSLVVASFATLLLGRFIPKPEGYSGTRIKIRTTLVILCYLFFTLLPLIILKFELAKGYPWNRWNEVELGWNLSSMRFELQYVRSLGFLILIIPFSLMAFFKTKKHTFWHCFLLFWFFSSFFLFPFANILKLGKFRFIEGAQIIPLAALSVWGFEYFSRLLKKVSLSLFILYFLVTTGFSTYYSTISLWGYFTNVYFRPEELSALSYLGKHVPSDSTVLADVFTSNFIPAFARVKTLVGFSDFYSQYTHFLFDEERISTLLTGTLSEKEAKVYLRKKNIDYVYQEKGSNGEKMLYPGILLAVYTSPHFTIYQVKKE